VAIAHYINLVLYEEKSLLAQKIKAIQPHHKISDIRKQAPHIKSLFERVP